MTTRTHTILMLAAGLTGTAAVQAFELTSTRYQTPILELYTSEGCSSCPPAERWLSRLTDSPRLWQALIPISWHVDYWDGLGWRDPYANAAYTARQQAYRTSGRSGAVYTPGFIYGGEEWRGWFDGERLPTLPQRAVGVLTLHEISGQVSVKFQSEIREEKALTVHLAWLGFGLKTKVERGENAGRILTHDFVLISPSEEKAKPKGGHYHWRMHLPEKPENSSRLALIAWVSDAGDPMPLQAVAGWYP